MCKCYLYNYDNKKLSIYALHNTQFNTHTIMGVGWLSRKDAFLILRGLRRMKWDTCLTLARLKVIMRSSGEECGLVI